MMHVPVDRSNQATTGPTTPARRPSLLPTRRSPTRRHASPEHETKVTTPRPAAAEKVPSTRDRAGDGSTRLAPRRRRHASTPWRCSHVAVFQDAAARHHCALPVVRTPPPVTCTQLVHQGSKAADYSSKAACSCTTVAAHVPGATVLYVPVLHSRSRPARSDDAIALHQPTNRTTPCPVRTRALHPNPCVPAPQASTRVLDLHAAAALPLPAAAALPCTLALHWAGACRRARCLACCASTSSWSSVFDDLEVLDQMLLWS